MPVPENASALLWGYDSATNTLGNAVTFVYAVDKLGTTIVVGPTDSPGFAVEVRWPGQYLLDGQSGGQCGRGVPGPPGQRAVARRSGGTAKLP